MDIFSLTTKQDIAEYYFVKLVLTLIHSSRQTVMNNMRFSGKFNIIIIFLVLS